jgi:hypothetical protein
VSLFGNLPPPTNFAEGQRQRYGVLVAGAGMFCGACAVTMIALLMWGNWSKDEEHTIVLIFGWTLGGFIFCMSAVIIGLLVGGPVGRFKAGVSKDGASFEAETEGAATATMTATISAPKTAAPPKGEAG